jgi:hypothetical protein
MQGRSIAIMLFAGLAACAQNRNVETGAATDTVVTDERVVRDTNLVERVDTVVETRREADTLLVKTDTTITVDTMRVEGDEDPTVRMDTTHAE